jgi:aminoglycoside phosphotransferase (APT) family kinase protein
VSDAAEPVRGIDAARVTEWFRANVPVAEPPLRFEIIPGGHSNLTYQVEDRRRARFVLRRPPLGAVLATAHDMGREYRIIAALGRTPVPVAPALGLCADAAVNGAPFYVMGYVEGPVLVDAATVRKCFDPAERRRIGLHLIEVLAALHAVSPDAVGLGDLGRREAYLARQIRRWRTQWESSKTRELAAMDEVATLLEQAMPAQREATIAHGDYRLGNCITGADARIAAVLDWELCTLGDPLADVGYLMNDWLELGETVAGQPAPNPTATEGFPSRAEALERYAALCGRDVSGLAYYQAFQSWRLAAIGEGVLARYEKGVMAGRADTEAMRASVTARAERALRLIRQLHSG